MEDNEQSQLRSVYEAWPSERIARCIAVESKDYRPEAILLMREILKNRGVADDFISKFAIPSGNVPTTPGPLFLHIPVWRLIVLSILSLSLYEAYWIYKNWQYIKKRDNLEISPFWRGFFGIFFCHSLLRRIHQDAEANAVQAPSFSASSLATGWVVLMILANLINRAPGIAPTIISAFIPSFLCFVPVQNYINAVSEKRNANEPYHGWSTGHIFCLIVGIILWGLLIFGAMADS